MSGNRATIRADYCAQGRADDGLGVMEMNMPWITSTHSWLPWQLHSVDRRGRTMRDCTLVCGERNVCSVNLR